MSHAPALTRLAVRSTTLARLPQPLAQILFVTAAGAGVIAGFILPDPATSARAIASAGPELTHLLRFMAAIKSLLVLTAAAAILWRLKSPISAARLAAYATLSLLMAAGIGEIWQMARVGLGAFFLHGALIATVLLLWRDPALHQQLAMAVSQGMRVQAR